MSVSYAGTDLILPATSEVDSWVTSHIRPQDLYEETFNLGTVRPWLWYDWPTKVRVGEVVWPCGAQRWGYAHFYAGQTEVDEILTTTSGEGYFDLVLDAELAGIPGSVTFSMAMLPPRPLSRYADVDGQIEPLYLLTFVDKRFYWWQNHVENINIAEGTTTWQQLFDQLETALGETFGTEDAVPADYLTPSRAAVPPGVPLPILFDNWAYWTGRRVVLDKDGTVNVLNAVSCFDRHEDNSLTSNLLTGGRFPWQPPESGTEDAPEVLNSFLPDSCTLMFPEVRDLQATPRIFAILKTMADSGLGVLSGITGDGAPYGYYYPLAAKFTGGTATTPDNNSQLQTLATRANTDFYSFQLGFLDQQESGTRDYTPDGLTRVEWLYNQDYTTTHIVREALPPPGFIPVESVPTGCGCFELDASYETCFTPPNPASRLGPLCLCFELDATSETCFQGESTCVCFESDCSYETCFEVSASSTTTQTIQRDATSAGNYNNVSVPSVNLWSITPTGGPVKLTGLDFGGVDGRHIEIRNDAASPAAGEAPLTITIPNLSSSSSSANQLSTPDGRNLYIDPNATVHLKYDATRGKVIQLDPKCCKGSSGGGPGSGGGVRNDSSTNRTYTNDDNNYVVNREQTGSGTDTLPDPPDTSPGYNVTVVNRGTGPLTYQADGGATIDGSATDTLSAGASASYRSDGTNYTAVPLGSSISSSAGSTSGTTVDAFVTVIDVTATVGILGVVGIRNTHGLNALNMKTTLYSALTGASSNNNQSVSAGNTLSLVVETLGPSFPLSGPWNQVTVEVQTNNPGNHATYDFKYSLVTM